MANRKNRWNLNATLISVFLALAGWSAVGGYTAITMARQAQTDIDVHISRDEAQYESISKSLDLIRANQTHMHDRLDAFMRDFSGE